MKEAHLKDTKQLIYSLPSNVTKDTRLAILQYKIIHHSLPTNWTLFGHLIIKTILKWCFNLGETNCELSQLIDLYVTRILCTSMISKDKSIMCGDTENSNVLAVA